MKLIILVRQKAIIVVCTYSFVSFSIAIKDNHVVINIVITGNNSDGIPIVRNI
ncbi:hypothetical protein MPUCK001_30250 [Citrobacter koseri]|nr:hypothetical protein MPUCK001_30250 [Citrobacter koseri]